jgi:hypothetical protein
MYNVLTWYCWKCCLHTYIFGDLPFISLIKEHHLAKCQTYTYVHMCNAVYINGRINSQAYIHLVVVGWILAPPNLFLVFHFSFRSCSVFKDLWRLETVWATLDDFPSVKVWTTQWVQNRTLWKKADPGHKITFFSIDARTSDSPWTSVLVKNPSSPHPVDVTEKKNVFLKLFWVYVMTFWQDLRFPGEETTLRANKETRKKTR